MEFAVNHVSKSQLNQTKMYSPIKYYTGNKKFNNCIGK
jgi:hypothetical protein